MDQEEKKELFRKVADIADTAKSILDYDPNRQKAHGFNRGMNAVKRR